MKKLILLILCCSVICLQAYAEIQNTKQRANDKIIQSIVNSPSGRISKHQTAFKEDYDLYNAGDKSSIFSLILKLENKYEKSKSDNADVNLEYIKKLKDFYMFLVKYPDEKTMSEEFVKEFSARKITVPDDVFDKLDEDLTLYISLINVYM